MARGARSAKLFRIIRPTRKACFGALQGGLELRRFTCIVVRLREYYFCCEFFIEAVMVGARYVEADDALLHGRM